MAFSTWVGRSRRSGGNWTTAAVAIPQSIDEVRVRLTVVAADFATPDLSVTAAVQLSADGGQTWAPQLTVQWIGGTPVAAPGKTPGWYAAVSGISQWAGMRARVAFTTVGTFRWGLEGEIR